MLYSLIKHPDACIGALALNAIPYLRGDDLLLFAGNPAVRAVHGAQIQGRVYVKGEGLRRYFGPQVNEYGYRGLLCIRGRLGYDVQLTTRCRYEGVSIFER